ncbi:HAD-IA family hydrolase [Thiomicrorhabdus cannonii]|uniref:HAD-IA family hydrolase n=1 Tax=Thiomicrorhabdus cannonii TaxID=2748011 RepID=UPI0031B5D793
MKKYRLVIFDWDGTLMNSEARIVASIQAAAERCGLPVLPAHEAKQIIGLSLDKAMLGLYPDATEAQLQAMAQSYTQSFLHECEVAMESFEGAEAMLFSLKNIGVKLAIATGKSRRGLDEVLKECGFGPYFDITRTPVESASKPDPLMLQQILEELEVELEHALMVGDTTFDMEMAHNINMDRVALTHGVHEAEALQVFNPLATFENLHQLHAWLVQRV